MNRLNQTATVLIFAALATTALGCNQAKSEALEGVKAVEAACSEDKEKGQKLGKEWYAKNEVFKKAVDGASQTWKLKDVSRFNYCGSPAFSEAKVRMENS